MATSDPYIPLIESLLADGEQGLARVEAFDWVATAGFGSTQPNSFGIDRYSLVLTNLMVRVVRFRHPSKWKLRKPSGGDAPSIAKSTAYQIKDIRGVGFATHGCARKAGSALQRVYGLDERPRVIQTLDLHMAGQTVTVSSVFKLGKIHEGLESLRTKRLLAEQQRDAGAGVRQLADLLRDGLISQAEFDRAKGALIGAEPNQTNEALASIRRLFQLMQSGALTEGVYRMAVAEQLVKLERTR